MQTRDAGRVRMQAFIKKESGFFEFLAPKVTVSLEFLCLGGHGFEGGGAKAGAYKPAGNG